MQPRRTRCGIMERRRSLISVVSTTTRWRASVLRRLKSIVPNRALRAKHSILFEAASLVRAEVFLETGTYLGETAVAAARRFARVHTIEISPELWRSSAAWLSKYANVTCHLGDSADVLPQVLKEVEAPAVIWLDAHWSRGITSRGPMDTPISAELDAVCDYLARTHYACAVGIDDLQCFDGTNGYPTRGHLLRRLNDRRLFDSVTEHGSVLMAMRGVPR